MPAVLSAGVAPCLVLAAGCSVEADPPLARTPDWLDVSVGRAEACAVRGSGEVVCWGRDSANAPGDNGTPLPPDPDGTFVSVDADRLICALDGEGYPTCWGAEEFLPPMVGDERYDTVATASGAACGVRTGDAALRCWGQRGSSPGGLPRPAGTFVDVDVRGTPWGDGTGEHAGCALDRTGSLACWGFPDAPSPPSGVRALQVGVGPAHACWLDDLGFIGCWGRKGLLDDRAEPPGGEFVQVSAGYAHTCGLRPTGRVECWGSEEWSAPDEVPDREFAMIDAGAGFTCGITRDDDLDCWGRGYPYAGMHEIPEEE